MLYVRNLPRIHFQRYIFLNSFSSASHDFLNVFIFTQTVKERDKEKQTKMYMQLMCYTQHSIKM